MFTGEIKDDRPVVKGGTVEKLVERLTFPAYAGMRNDIAARYSWFVAWFVAASTHTARACVRSIRRPRVSEGLHVDVPLLHDAARVDGHVEEALHARASARKRPTHLRG